MFRLILLCCLVVANAVHLPENFKLCSKKDPDFGNCVGTNMMDALSKLKDGNKNLGVPSLEPFSIDRMEIPGNEAASVNLNQNYKSVKFYGMSQGIAKNVKIDLENCHWSFNAISPKIQMLSEYEMKGKLLVFPINGFGKSNTTMTDLDVRYEIDCSYNEKNGKKYMKFDKIKMNMKPGKVYFNFENLFPGNAQMSATLDKTVNENSEVVFNDVKSAFEEVFSQIWNNLANSVLSKVPIDEIFLN
ncbi:unnamed protein product [Brassicogethes aeneus]|uniref:Uncharacterized protein n=1 Tax=Brassicogethes aeneus TaxID=1431903 RepID=A0A9P0FCM0_BRAAE|nr:unnamed protein product [Brassicogethes aeneus]